LFQNVDGNKVFSAINPADFKAIYDETMQVIYKVSFRIVGDAEAAEDIAHDSLIKMSEKALVFPSLNDAKYWLIRVAKNASLNYAKRKQHEQKLYARVLYENSRQSESGETDYLKAETRKRAQDALDKLPVNLKTTVVLREYAELSYKEIGRVMGITEGNVKIRLFRARAMLANLIGEENVYLP
jgi:RNA polymerase sigma-70 factor (ECF subfamily)